jgi:hypothetical protein
LRGTRIATRVRVALVTAGAALLVIPALAITASRAVEPKTGKSGQFNTACQFSHRGPDDPIVFPGESGKSHSHDFIGNRTTDAFSSYDSLRTTGTTCERAADPSAYWIPTLYQNGVPLPPADGNVYYRTALREPQSIRPFPAGLRMIAGDAKHETIQPKDVIHWGCDPDVPSVRDRPPSGSPRALEIAAQLKQAQARLKPTLRAIKRHRRALRRLRRGGVKRSERRKVRRRRAALKRKRLAYRKLVRSIVADQAELDRIVKSSNVAVPTCPGGSLLELIIRFPDCWNGTDVDSGDHKSHMAYSEYSRASGFNECPRSHPVPVPKLSVTLRYASLGGPDVRLASGLGYTAHADFFDAWDPEVFANLVRDCLNADAYCGKGSRPNAPPQPAPQPKPPGSSPSPTEPPPDGSPPPEDEPAPIPPILPPLP